MSKNSHKNTRSASGEINHQFLKSKYAFEYKYLGGIHI
ncbi:hypothetical protein NIES4101_74020 [Calothrix sp. NIES-4101]|nr:hypothetical protein NIES4101_74020 [Calothrix sp. NIES-4101]